MKAGAVLVLLLLAATPTAEAAPSPGPGAPPSAERPAPASPEDGGLRTANERLRQAETRLQRLRQAQLVNFEQLEALAVGPQRAVVLLHRARLLDEEARAAGDLAETYFDDLQEASEGPERQRVQDTTDAERRRGRQRREETVKTLRRALDLGPDRATRAELLHLLAESLQALGKREAALSEYQRVLGAAPGSLEARQAAYELGEVALEGGRPRDAVPLFEQARGAGALDSLVVLARRRLAWCQFQGARRRAALLALQGLLTELRALPEPSSLTPQIRADYLYVLAQIGGYRKARQHLRRAFGRQEARAMTLGLAEHYLRDRRHDEALAAHRDLLAGPLPAADAALCRWRVVEGLLAQRRQDEAWAELVAGFEGLGELRATPEARSPRAIQARILAEERARPLLLRRHDELLAASGEAEGLRDGAVLRADETTRLLSAYLDLFPAAPGRWTMRLALADLLYLRRRHADAATHFEAVFDDPAAGELRQEAGKGAALALGTLLDELQQDAGERSDAGKGPAAERLLRVCTGYLESFPTAAAAVLVRTERAHALGTLGRRSEAATEYVRVAAGGGVQGLAAADSLLALHLGAEDWSALAAAAAELKELEGLRGGGFQARAEAVRCKAELEAARAGSPSPGAATPPPSPALRLQAYALQEPSCPEAPPALQEAARRFAEAGELARARRALQTLVDQYPSSELASTAEFELVGLHEAAGDLAAAAALLGRLARSGDCAQRVSLGLRAAALHEGLEETEEATRVRRDLARACWRDPRVATSLLQGARRALERGQHEEARRRFTAWRAAARGDPQAELTTRLYLEALALAGGGHDSLELEGLLAEYLSLTSPGELCHDAAAWAVYGAVAGLVLRVAELAAGQEPLLPEELEELALVSAALERWAATAASAGGDLRARLRALALAVDGLAQVAGLLDTVASERRAVSEELREVEGLLEQARALRQDMERRAGALVARAVAQGPLLDVWYRRARLASGPRTMDLLWEGLLPHIIPGPGAAHPYPTSQLNAALGRSPVQPRSTP